MTIKEFENVQVGDIVWADLGSSLFKVRIEEKTSHGFAKISFLATGEKYCQQVMAMDLFTSDADVLTRINRHISYFTSVRNEIMEKRNNMTIGK